MGWPSRGAIGKVVAWLWIVLGYLWYRATHRRNVAPVITSLRAGLR